MTTHWKKLINPHYLGAYSLDPGEKRTVTIQKVVRETVTGENNRQEECTVAHLAGEKPFILNRTNCKTITKIYSTPYIEEWAGKQITIFAAKVKAFGDTVEALRIVEKKPALPELSPSHPKWNDAVKAAEAGQIKPEQIKSKYKMSDANLTLLFTPKTDES